MKNKLRALLLIGLGFAGGSVTSLSLLAGAQDAPAKTSLSPATLQEVRKFTNVFGMIKERLIREVSDKKLIDGCIVGMTAAADQDSEFLSVEENAELSIPIRGEFGSIGVELRVQDFYPTVVTPLDGGPAARSSLRPGDAIQEIDRVSTKGKSLVATIKMLRGRPNTPIVLKVAHTGNSITEEITMQREVIRLRPPQVKWLDPGVALLRVSDFRERTGEDLARQLTGIFKSANVTGLVLDLRSSPGGLLHSAIGISAAFLPPGTSVVKVSARNPQDNHDYKAVPAEYTLSSDFLRDLPEAAKTVPMVVLVDHGTAAGSEIVAAALHDYKRAILIGEKTFGRGSIQTKVDLGDGSAVKLTTGEWITPAGQPISHVGIQPDIEVARGPDGGDAQAERALQVLRARK